jgi:molybdopterin-guanine dinucleotide biosynthesis protein A
MEVAQADDAAVVVAMTQESPCEQRHHWVCCLINRRVLPQTEEAFVKGERKIGRWIQSLRWRTVCFDRPEEFMNINTLETRHGGD